MLNQAKLLVVNRRRLALALAIVAALASPALLLLGSAAHAQQAADAGKAKSKHPRAMQYNERQLHEAELAKKRRVLVKCRDGSRHIARVCRRHGGVA